MAKQAADALCAPLRAFAASIGADEKREITFRTSWGGNFKDAAESVIYAKRCEHNNYPQAKTVCSALMDDGSVEFGKNNAMRAISCLSPETHFGGSSFERGEFSLHYGTPDGGASVQIAFEEDPKVGGMALRITADGY
jgi:hypothetical protein